MDFLKNKLLTIVLVLCLAFTIIIGVTASKKGNKGFFQDFVTGAITPVQKYFYSAGQRVSNISYFISSISSTRKENTALKTEIDDLRRKLIEYDKFKRENEELSKMLKFKNSHPEYTLKGANVVGKVGDEWFSILLLDVGEADGIKKEQFVITSNGLVGQIIETTKTTSKVMTILNENARISVMISSTGDVGILSGSGSSKEECKITFLPVETKAKTGDTIVTSNVIKDENTLTPQDVLIGFIERMEDEKPNLVKAAYLRPVVDFNKLEKVMVIIN